MNKAQDALATAIKEKLPDRPPSWVIDIIQKNQQDEDAVKQIRARYNFIKDRYPKYTSQMFNQAGAYGGTDAASTTQRQTAQRKSAKAARAKAYLDKKAAERAKKAADRAERPVSESVKSLKIKIIESRVEEKVGLKTRLSGYEYDPNKYKPPVISSRAGQHMTWEEVVAYVESGKLPPLRYDNVGNRIFMKDLK